MRGRRLRRDSRNPVSNRDESQAEITRSLAARNPRAAARRRRARACGKVGCAARRMLDGAERARPFLGSAGAPRTSREASERAWRAPRRGPRRGTSEASGQRLRSRNPGRFPKEHRELPKKYARRMRNSRSERPLKGTAAGSSETARATDSGWEGMPGKEGSEGVFLRFGDMRGKFIRPRKNGKRKNAG